MSDASLFANAGALILAAGKGTRMYSSQPKVLQCILEEPMLSYIYKTLRSVFGKRVWTVVGYQAQSVLAAFPEREGSFVLQSEQLGTGHALQLAWPRLLEAGFEYVLVVNGDSPLVPEDVLRSFAQTAQQDGADISFATLTLPDPGSFGRVVRVAGEVRGIVEAKDYDEKTHGPEPKEINAGVYFLKTAAVTGILPRLDRKNKSGELYITDIVGLGVAAGLKITGYSCQADARLLGINTPEELVRSEEHLRQAIVQAHMREGVIIRSPHTVRIGPRVRIARGAEITGPCEIYGTSQIGAGVRIESHCRLFSTVVEEGASVHSFCHMQEAQVGPSCIVGPYARLRPGAVLEEGAHVGNFVEVKKARLGKGAKANHLTYLGDAEVGAGANVGAGTITCNYDGRSKHITRIGERAFIGSNVALVAPVSVGDEALIGAGSVITRDVPAKHLGVTRAEQRMVPRKK